MSHEAERAAIVAEARTWLSTPWKHQADIKGVGVDCAMLPLAVAKKLGHVPGDYDPRPYPLNWFVHHEDELLIHQVERYAHRIEREKLEPADLILYRFGKCASHAAIVIDGDYVIHAYAEQGNVTLQERRALERREHSYWSVFT